MKQERKGQGTGRKKNKRSASEAFDTTEGGDGESSAKKKPLPMPEFKHKKVLKDKTGTIQYNESYKSQPSYEFIRREFNFTQLVYLTQEKSCGV